MRCHEITQRCSGWLVATRSANSQCSAVAQLTKSSSGWKTCAHAQCESALQFLWVPEAGPHQCRMGGLAPSLVVELANGSRAVVLDVNEQSVKLDANSMLAGKKLIFEIELMGIEASS